MGKPEKLLTGMLAIVIATIFILGGLGFLMYGQPIISTDIDILIAFIALAIGVWYVAQTA